LFYVNEISPETEQRKKSSEKHGGLARPVDIGHRTWWPMGE
jgi:hypothetical protein